MTVSDGDTVLYGKYAGTEIQLDGDDVLIMRESDILGIVNGVEPCGCEHVGPTHAAAPARSTLTHHEPRNRKCQSKSRSTRTPATSSRRASTRSPTPSR